MTHSITHAMAAYGPISLFAAVVAGAAGSAHCLVMCGGLSGALGMRARRGAATPARAFAHALTYQIGRIISYSIAGALVGAFGGMLLATFQIERMAIIFRVLAGLVLVLAAIGVLFKWRPLARLERLGAHLWKHVAPAARTLPTADLRGSLLLGMIWGWLPCGLIYSMLLVAALAGGPLQGAATMASFGLGTAPAVLGAAVMGGAAGRLTLARRATARGFNFAAGSLLLVFGVLTMLGPLGVHAMH